MNKPIPIRKNKLLSDIDTARLATRKYLDLANDVEEPTSGAIFGDPTKGLDTIDDEDLDNDT